MIGREQLGREQPEHGEKVTEKERAKDDGNLEDQSASGNRLKHRLEQRLALMAPEAH